MNVTVNGNNLDITLENEQTVGDVLRGLEEALAQNDATTVHIVLNGKAVSADAFDTISQTPLADDTDIALTVVSESEVYESLTYEAKIAREIARALEAIPVQLQSGKDKEANGIISRLADFVDSFCRSASLTSLFPALYSQFTIEGKGIDVFFADFSGILADFKQALEDKDTVLIGDLAEYEISPRLLAIAAAVEKLDSTAKGDA